MTEIKTVEKIIEVQEDAKVDEEERKWCVYMHTNKVNGKKYIGITSKPVEERWKNGFGYKTDTYIRRAIDKYTWDGFEHVVIVSNLSEQEAKLKEIEMIALYKTNCKKYYNPTYGYNMTDGGDGSFGRFHTEATKDKISKSRIGKYTGENNPNYNNHKLAGENNPMYGKCHSEETRAKISKNRKGKGLGGYHPITGKKNYFYDNHEFSGINNGRALPIYCNELNEIFWGAKDAEEKYKIAHQGIAKCCKGKRNYAGKHPTTKKPLHWLYIEDQIDKNGMIIQGAISLGHVTRKQFNDYLNSLKERNDK